MNNIMSAVVDVLKCVLLAVIFVVLLPFALLYMVLVWIIGVTITFKVNGKPWASLRWFSFKKY